MLRRTFLGALGSVGAFMVMPIAIATAGSRRLSGNGVSLFPSVRELEAGLNAAPGAQLPKQIVSRGRAWNAYYLGARSVGNGVYEIKVRLV
jgi:hypothetical protein